MYSEKGMFKQITFMITEYPEPYDMLCQTRFYLHKFIDDIEKWISPSYHNTMPSTHGGRKKVYQITITTMQKSVL